MSTEWGYAKDNEVRREFQGMPLSRGKERVASKRKIRDEERSEEEEPPRKSLRAKKEEKGGTKEEKTEPKEKKESKKNGKSERTINDGGPSTWSEAWPVAVSGKRQSPVDIRTSQAQEDASLQQTPISYQSASDGQIAKLSNSGAGWKVEWEDEEGVKLSGGPLGESVYRLKQFHCHWGRDSSRGSEHTVDGKPYSGELHLVHWNKDLYPQFSTAACQEDGLAVLGIFLKVGKSHPELEKVTSQLSAVKYRGDNIELKAQIDPLKLLPESQAYWTYLGSLTTPPCYESVTWIVFKEPIEVSEEQLESFRSLCCDCMGDKIDSAKSSSFLLENFRPTLPIGERELRGCGCMNAS